jgi:hypothetical protein
MRETMRRWTCGVTDTAPAHPRNLALRDDLGKLQQASDGQIKTKLFENVSLLYRENTARYTIVNC